MKIKDFITTGDKEKLDFYLPLLKHYDYFLSIDQFSCTSKGKTISGHFKVISIRII